MLLRVAPPSRIALRSYLRSIRSPKVESVSAGVLEVRVGRGRRRRLTEALGEVDTWCSEHGRLFVVAFDEAQYLRFTGRRFDLLLAWALDNLRRVSFVLTGSEVGLLRDFLRLDSADSPLRGRVRREVRLESFTYEQSLEFLRRGFEELRLEVPRYELEEAASTLGGVPGWLTLYGYYRGVRRVGHREALKAVIEEGSAVVLSELEKVVEGSRPRYVAILKAVASGCRR